MTTSMCLETGKSKIKVHALLPKREMSGPCMEEVPEIPECKQCVSSVLSIMYSGLTISNSLTSFKKKVILASFQFLRRNPLNQRRSHAQHQLSIKPAPPILSPLPVLVPAVPTISVFCLLPLVVQFTAIHFCALN